MKWILKDKEKFREMSKALEKGTFTDASSFHPPTHYLRGIGVGDYTCNHVAHLIDFGVIDGETRRQTYTSDIDYNILGTVWNLAGEVSPSLFEALEDLLHVGIDYKPGVLMIKGEEDLAVLPIILLCQSTSCVYWGDPERNCTVWTDTSTASKHLVLQIMAECGEWVR